MFLVWVFSIRTCRSCWRLSASILFTKQVFASLCSCSLIRFRRYFCGLMGCFMHLSLTILCIQISGITIWGSGSSKRCSLLCAGRPVDTHSFSRCHTELCDPREEQPRADRLLFYVGRQCPSSSQRGSGPVDGHRTVADS